MARTGENIYKRKDGRWEARSFKHDTAGDARYRSFYGKTREEAKQKRDIRLKAESASSTQANATLFLSFTVLAQNWLNNAKLRVKESTFARYWSQVHNHILPSLGEYQALNISVAIVAKFVENLMKSSKDGGFGLSPKTAEDILIIIKGIMKFGKCPCYQELLEIKLRKEYKKPQTLPNTDQSKLAKYLLSACDCIKAGILLCMFIGARIGEICAVRWCDIDLDAGILSITQTIQRIQVPPDENNGRKTKVVIAQPKSRNSIRDIHIPGFLTAILRKMEGQSDCYILTGSTKPMEPRTLLNHYKKLLTEAGTGYYNFHALRHSYATRYIAEGFDVKSLSEILGHSSVRTTLELYVHPAAQLKRENIEKLANMIVGGL